MVSIKNTILALSLLASTAVAHFTLDYPTSRGFDEDIEPQFCGGFPDVENPRIPFPLGSAPVHFNSHHTLATVDLLVSTVNNPTAFANFSSTLAKSFFQVGNGQYCFNINLGAMNLGLTNGSNVTIQMQFNGGDGNLFQCADLVLLSNYTVPSNETCTNDASLAANATSSLGNATASLTASGSAMTGMSMSMSSTASSTAAATSKASGAFKNAYVGIVIGGLAAIAGLVAVI